MAKYNSTALIGRGSPERRQGKIFEELYKKKEKKEDVPSELIEFEKNKNECTFKPKIGDQKKRLNKLNTDKSVLEVPVPETARPSTTANRNISPINVKKALESGKALVDLKKRP